MILVRDERMNKLRSRNDEITCYKMFFRARFILFLKYDFAAVDDDVNRCTPRIVCIE